MESKENKIPGWVIWFVGLPGAGKSAYAQAVYQALQKKGENVRYLSMDERRKAYFHTPRYTAEERAEAYELFAKEAAQIAEEGTNVIMDGAAPKLFMREYARRLVPHFAEIFVRCPLETAMRREANRPGGFIMADIYQKALKRKKLVPISRGWVRLLAWIRPLKKTPWLNVSSKATRRVLSRARTVYLLSSPRGGLQKYLKGTSYSQKRN